MNNEIAYALVDAELRLRMLPYSKLAAMVAQTKTRKLLETMEILTSLRLMYFGTTRNLGM